MKDNFPPAEERAMLKLMLEKLQHTEIKAGSNIPIWMIKTLSLIKDHVRLKITSIETIRALHLEMLKHFNNVTRITAECRNYGLGMAAQKSNKSLTTDIKEDSNKELSGGGGGKSLSSSSNPTHLDARRSDHTPTAPCTGCGRTHSGGAADCSLKTHPDWNHSTSPWSDSEKGKAWLAKDDKALTLPGGRCLDGSTREFSFPTPKTNNFLTFQWQCQRTR